MFSDNKSLVLNQKSYFCKYFDSEYLNERYYYIILKNVKYAKEIVDATSCYLLRHQLFIEIKYHDYFLKRCLIGISKHNDNSLQFSFNLSKKIYMFEQLDKMLLTNNWIVFLKQLDYNNIKIFSKILDLSYVHEFQIFNLY